MNTVQVVENLLVNGRQFIVQPNDPVKSAFVTFRSMWAAAAALLAVLAVTVLTVTVRSWRAASENPADSVKSE